MVSMSASSLVDRGFEPWSGQTKDYTIGTCCFSVKHGIRIMCPSGATCLPADCCFSELAVEKFNFSGQSEPHHHLIEN
jgi:hypothetical protein